MAHRLKRERVSEGGEAYEPPRRGWDQTRDSGERHP